VCSICEDGSPITKPDGIIQMDGVDWRCDDLSEMLWLLGADAADPVCESLHYSGFLNCGCPSISDEKYCALCPGAITDLPNPNISIPGFDDLKCSDIVYVRRDNPLAPIPCTDLHRYSKLCQCPERCSFCRYSDESPAHVNKTIPYLTEGDQQVTCGEYATETNKFLRGGECDAFRNPPVPINVEGYCGCPKMRPPNLCPLCHDGGSIRDPNLKIPNVGGLTCQELEEYLMYVTDPEVCVAVSNRSQDCCGHLDPCPVCADGSHGKGSGKVYKPYNLGCDQIGQASDFGFPLTCEEAQQQFPFFCGCKGVLAECTICPLNQVPPIPSLFIPMLNITCGEANDLVSLSNSSHCADTLADFKIDVAGFCGCGKDTSLFGRCAFCPEGYALAYDEDAVVSRSAPHSNIFGNPILPYTPTLEKHCKEMETLAAWVTDAEMCLAVQQSVPQCCRSTFTDAPTISAPPSILPSSAPTFMPTPNATNATFWGNSTGWGNSTNETAAPLPTPPPTFRITTPPTPMEESSAFSQGARGSVLAIAVLALPYML
jgi:hypothetical protein